MDSPAEIDRFGRETLRYVRLMLLAVPLLLVVAIVIYALVNHRIENSISSYYLGPARDVFVAMMASIGILLVVYTGPVVEDLALNLAGFYALIVAFVPTELRQTLALLTADERGQQAFSIQVSVIAVLIASAVFGFLGWRTNKWPAQTLFYSWWSGFLSIASVALLGAFALFLGYRLVEGTYFAGVHVCAAILLVLSMALAIASHLGPQRLCEQDTSGGKAKHYAVLLILMLLGLIAWPVLLWAGVSQALFIIEWFQIGIFGYFWALETRRLWH